MEKTLKNITRDSSRPRRSPLAGRNRLHVRNQEPGYQYRIVNANLESDPDRIQNLIDQGYEIVPNGKAGPVGEAKVDNPSAMSSAGDISVGQGTKAIVMRTPMEYFIEDQATKQRENDTNEQRAERNADYGSVKISTDKK